MGGSDVTVFFVVLIVGVTVLRLLLAYWDTEDDAQTADRAAAGPSAEAERGRC